MSDYYRKYFEPEYGEAAPDAIIDEPQEMDMNIQRNGGLKRILKQLQH